MGTLTNLLIKWGLGAAIPYLVPILVGTLLGGGGLAAWWGDLADYKTAIVFVIGIGAGLVAMTTDNKLLKATALVVIVGMVYLKGHIDGTAEVDTKVKAAEDAGKAAVAATHAQYAAALQAEKDRQTKAADEARVAAAAAKAKWDKERAELKVTLQTLQKEAADAKDANEISLDIDDIRRLNQLRYDPKRDRRVPGDHGKAKAGKTSLYDDTTVPTLAGPPRAKAHTCADIQHLAWGRSPIRDLPPPICRLCQMD